MSPFLKLLNPLTPRALEEWALRSLRARIDRTISCTEGRLLVPCPEH